MDKACGNIVRYIVERFIKHIASTTFSLPVYSLDGPGPYIAISGPHEGFFNSVFGIWIGEENSDGCCITIGICEVWRALGLRQHRVEHM